MLSGRCFLFWIILNFEHKEIEMAKDPVCGMNVDPKTAAGKSEYERKT